MTWLIFEPICKSHPCSATLYAAEHKLDTCRDFSDVNRVLVRSLVGEQKYQLLQVKPLRIKAKYC